MSTQLEIFVTEGPLKGRRFSVPADGLRLGRSSSCEISIPDPALSRNHCLFETRDGGLWVTDLASANGTIVNDVQLGDVNQDRQIDIADAIGIVNRVVRKDSATFIEKAADVNGDGQVDIADAIAVVNIVVRKSSGARQRKAHTENLDPQ